ncbi:MAG TPA: 50S ribosomal protein L6 [Sphingobacteriaceae bacterium]|nr:50S ribosomal protein L6 [Sphingobacteriaceae bacterium]
MSRVGKNPIAVPAGVKVEVAGQEVRVEGPKGKLSRKVHPALTVTVEGDTIQVQRKDDSPESRAMHGLTRSLIANMVTGVSEGFSRTLVLEGVGYRAALQGKKLSLSLGFSHPVEVTPPEGIELEVPQPNTIVVKGISKELVGNVAAAIRARRPISRYRYADGPRGIRYSDERPAYKAVKAGR